MRDPNVTRVRDVRYAPGGRRGLLDVYHRPDRPSGAPVLLQVHGGAWMVGTKNGQAIPLMQRMARRGWVCVAPNYPLSPKAAWPEHVIALKRAIAWIRENIAEYGGDPSFIATTGGSAGGHLSALLALTPNDPAWQPGFTDADTSIQACVPHYGAYDLASTSGLHHDLILRDEVFGPKVVQKPFAGNEQIFRDASPLLRVNPDAPPFFVVHGATDTLLSVATARMFAQRLREVSAQPVAYLELSGAQHGFDMFPSIRSAHVLNGVQRFLDWSYRRTRTRPLVAL
jgi:acetyl esterase/lipase